tara:strand:- start:4854 stop:5426 length:573 start_codon:yes stop_codon:yes gene_type:complete
MVKKLTRESFLPSSSFMWKDGSKDTYNHPPLLNIQLAEDIEPRDGVNLIVFVESGEVDFSIEALEVEPFMLFLLKTLAESPHLMMHVSSTYARLHDYATRNDHKYIIAFSPNQDLGNCYPMESTNDLEELTYLFEQKVQILKRGGLKELHLEDEPVFNIEGDIKFLISVTKFYGDQPEDPNQMNLPDLIN